MLRASPLPLLLGVLVLAPGCLEASQPGWALEATQLDAVQGRADGAWIRVAILDTGIDVGHPALRHLTDGDPFDGELVAYQDFLSSSDDPQDPDGHGSFVAGVLAGRPPSGLGAVLDAKQGVDGLAPGVQLIVGRLCDEVGDCALFALREAIRWALDQKADIISLSLGFEAEELAAAPEYESQVRRVLGQASAEGVLVVAAAGNGGKGGVLFPADDPRVLAVAAVGKDLRPRASTAWGHAGKPDLAAPGESIVGPSHAGLQRVDGTSAAVPFVVAAAAILMQGGGDPDGSVGLDALRQALVGTAKPLPGQTVPQDARLGRGMLQAEAAWDAYSLR